MSRGEITKGKVGFGYMLHGGSTPSNVDPFATELPAGKGWMQEPPHVMVFKYGEAMAGYSERGEHEGTTQPWANRAGTYEHLMIPVQ